jgi:hypothetical protein
LIVRNGRETVKREEFRAAFRFDFSRRMQPAVPLLPRMPTGGLRPNASTLKYVFLNDLTEKQ